MWAATWERMPDYKLLANFGAMCCTYTHPMPWQLQRLPRSDWVDKVAAGGWGWGGGMHGPLVLNWRNSREHGSQSMWRLNADWLSELWGLHAWTPKDESGRTENTCVLTESRVV